MPYFGVIEEIWEQLGFTLVDLNKVAYMDKPFIMAEQARQVFYVQDVCDSIFSVVQQGRLIGINDQNDDSTLDICETTASSTKMPSIIEQNEVDDVHAIRNDHHEGLWENIPT